MMVFGGPFKLCRVAEKSRGFGISLAQPAAKSFIALIFWFFCLKGSLCGIKAKEQGNN
jgi:hypothetical protein